MPDHSFTNFILTALAISDLLPMLTYLPYAGYFYCVEGIHDKGYPLPWILFLLFNNNFIITSHTVSVWLTVTLAVFRYIAVCHHALARRVCTLRHARIAAACIVGAAVIVCVPTYLMYLYQPKRPSTDNAANGTISSFDFAVGYNVEIPENLSVTVSVDAESHSQQMNGGAGGSLYEIKEFAGLTFRTVNFWVYGTRGISKS